MVFRALIVAAVSTTDQAADDKNSIPQQLEDCRAVCEAHEWQIVREITIPGHSRSYTFLDELVADSPDYAEIMRVVRSGAINLLVCRHHNRLWRTQELQQAVMAICRHEKVQVYSINEPTAPVDPATYHPKAISKLIDSIHGFAAEADTEARLVAIRDGLRGRIKAGLHGCNSHPPYGYKFEPATTGDGKRMVYRMVPDATQAPWVRWMFARRAEGWPFARIAAELQRQGVKPYWSDRWWYSTVRGILSNRTYLGESHWGDVTNAHASYEPLIDQALWDAAQRASTLRSKSWIRNTRALTGLCRCGKCGHGMVYNAKSGHRTYEILNCALYTRQGGRECVSNIWRADRVEKLVMVEVLEAIADPQAHLARRSDQQSQQQRVELRRIEEAIKQKQKQFGRWSNAYENEAITLEELTLHRARLDGETQALAKQREALAASISAEDGVLSALERIRTAGVDLATCTPVGLRTIYMSLIRYVELPKGQDPIIHWW